jgi:hypothetical protein
LIQKSFPEKNLLLSQQMAQRIQLALQYWVLALQGAVLDCWLTGKRRFLLQNLSLNDLATVK